MDFSGLTAGDPWAEILLSPMVALVGEHVGIARLSLLGCLAALWIAYARYRNARPPREAPPARSLYGSRSARIDGLFFLLVPVGLTAAGQAGIRAWSEWDWALGPAPGAFLSSPGTELFCPAGAGLELPRAAGEPEVFSSILSLVYLGLVVVTGDFVLGCVHLACHRWRWLWRLHAIHHRASFLTPFTGAREHPLVLVREKLSYGAAVGGVLVLVRMADPDAFVTSQ